MITTSSANTLLVYSLLQCDYEVCSKLSGNWLHMRVEIDSEYHELKTYIGQFDNVYSVKDDLDRQYELIKEQNRIEDLGYEYEIVTQGRPFDSLTLN